MDKGNAAENVAESERLLGGLRGVVDRTSACEAAGKYRSWAMVADMLHRRGMSLEEVECVLLSSWPLIAIPNSTPWVKNGGGALAGDLRRYMDDPRNGCTDEALSKILEKHRMRARKVAVGQ